MTNLLEVLERKADGRNIDPRLGTLSGEASGQRVRTLTPHAEDHGLKEESDGEGSTTYYGLPAIKPPVWIWSIPAYLYVGGTSGAASLLGMVALATGGPGLRRMEERCRVIGMGGDLLSAGLLIHDLGRPSRFLNMLRVFRPTSPMSIGSWVLATSGAANTAAVLFGSRRGALGVLGKTGVVAGGLLGVPLAGYTAVLLANTAVPIWQRARRTLPVLFMASGMASAGALLDLLPASAEALRTQRAFGVIGKGTALAMMRVTESAAAKAGRVVRPLREGPSGTLWTAGKVCTAVGLVLSLLPQTRSRRTVAAVVTTLGALAIRFAVFHAGKTSARDPRATFEPQRAGFGATEVAGKLERRPASFRLPVVR